MRSAALQALAVLTTVAIVLICVFVIGPARVQPYQRLPRTTIPRLYNLTLHPDFRTLRFRGFLSVHLEVSKNWIRQIELHSLDLEFESIKLFDETHEQIPVSYGFGRRDRLFVRSKRSLKIGKYELEFVYNGNVSNNMEGVYRSTYKNRKGDLETIITTQFQALSARKAFPCWDEPSFKAVFLIHLVIPDNMSAVSNMPATSKELIDDLIKVSFSKTPPMSTYLLAFSIGRFEARSQTDSSGVVHTILTRPGKQQLADFAMNVSLKALPYFAEYFGLNYPLPKLDLVAIPDFSYGAMENWGCSIFREQYLLVDPVSSSRYDLQKIAIIVGHELAHQWFGNLVTLEWWTDVWLNEGFATWIEYLCTDYLFPEFDIWSQFVGESIRPAMLIDRLSSTHPIEVQLYDHSSVMEVFGVVSYNKGASIIRMIHKYMGEKKFREGLTQYLRTHKYQNTRTADLWSSFENSSGLRIKEIMSSWTENSGFPLVRIDRINKDSGTELTLRQERMFCLGSRERFSSADHRDHIWNIVITAANSSDPLRTALNFLMNTRTKSIVVPDQPAWFKFNIGKSGFYVVHYSDQMLDSLIRGNEFLRLSVSDRFDLQFDLYILAVSGYRSLGVYLDFVEAYSKAISDLGPSTISYLNDMIVWRDLASNLNDILSLAEYVGRRTHLRTRKMIAQVFEPVALIFDREIAGDAKDYENLRDLAKVQSGKSDVEWVKDKAFKACEKWMADNEAELLGEIGVELIVCVHHSKPQGIVQSLMKLVTRDVVRLRHFALAALGGSQNETELQQVLEFNFFSGHVRKQDFGQVAQATSNSVLGRTVFWSFMKRNFNAIKSQVTEEFLIDKILKKALNNFASVQELNDVRTFLNKNLASGKTSRKLDQLYERIMSRALLVNNQKAVLMAYFRNRSRSRRTRTIDNAYVKN